MIQPTREDLHSIFLDHEITPPQKLVLTAMYSNADREGMSTVISSMPRQALAHYTGYSARQITRIIKGLEESRAIRPVYKVRGNYTYHLQGLSGRSKA